MSKRVLDIGNCGPDHASIRRALLKHFEVEVIATDDFRDASEQLRKQTFDLILVNRKLDIDYSDGLEVVRRLKADPEFRNIPVMLVSNYPEAQVQAVAEGAEAGFGKLELGAAATIQKLSNFLGPSRA